MSYFVCIKGDSEITKGAPLIEGYTYKGLQIGNKVHILQGLTTGDYAGEYPLEDFKFIPPPVQAIHVHYDILQAYSLGYKVQVQSSMGFWNDVHAPIFNKHAVYRINPNQEPIIDGK